MLVASVGVKRVYQLWRMLTKARMPEEDKHRTLLQRPDGLWLWSFFFFLKLLSAIENSFKKELYFDLIQDSEQKGQWLVPACGRWFRKVLKMLCLCFLPFVARPFGLVKWEWSRFMSHTDFSGAGNQPADHLSPSPVQCGQSHPHYLQTHTRCLSPTPSTCQQRSTTKDLLEQTNVPLHQVESNADATNQGLQFNLIESFPSTFIYCNLTTSKSDDVEQMSSFCPQPEDFYLQNSKESEVNLNRITLLTKH